MARKVSKAARGLTLMEVLTTMVFVALVLPAVAKGVSIAVRAQTAARNRLEAAMLLDAKLEELMAYSGWEGQNLSGNFSPHRPDMRWTVVSVLRDDGLTEIIAVASWVEYAYERSLTLSALVYRGTQ